MRDYTILPSVLGVYLCGAFALGWWAARRAPDGIEARLWRRLPRRLRAWRSA